MFDAERQICPSHTMQVDSSREAVHGILQQLWEAGVEEYIKAGQPHVKYLPQLMVDEGNASCWISVMDYKDAVGRGGGREWNAGRLDGVGKRLMGRIRRKKHGSTHLAGPVCECLPSALVCEHCILLEGYFYCSPCT